MSNDGTDCSQVPGFIVPPFMVKQPRCVLPPGTVLKSVPIQVGTFVLGPPNKLPLPAHSEPNAYSMNVFQDLKTFDMKVSNKGRRPKHAVAEEVDRLGESGPGMSTERPMCTTCGKYFMSRQQLNQHMLVHTDVRKYKCQYCERTFKQPSHLHQHHRIHTGEKPYKCPMPGCFRAFPQQSNLNHHLRNHDKPAPPPENTCSLCMRTYASETVLRSHISKIHMCDPDALLGLRIKTPSSDFSRSQNTVNVSPNIVARGLEREKIEESINNERVQQQTDLEQMHTPVFVVKQEAVNESNLQTPYRSSKLNSGNNIPVFKQETEDRTELNLRENYKTESSAKPINTNSAATCYRISETSGDISNINTEATANKHSFLDDTNDVKVDIRRTYSSETSPISGLNVPVSSNYAFSSNHNDGESTEAMPPQLGRSRKRKAFQPQRIVKTFNAND